MAATATMPVTPSSARLRGAVAARRGAGGRRRVRRVGPAGAAGRRRAWSAAGGVCLLAGIRRGDSFEDRWRWSAAQAPGRAAARARRRRGIEAAAEGADQRDAAVERPGLEVGPRAALVQHVGFGVEHREVAAEAGPVALRGQVVGRFGGRRGERLLAPLALDRAQRAELIGGVADRVDHGGVVGLDGESRDRRRGRAGWRAAARRRRAASGSPGRRRTARCRRAAGGPGRCWRRR